MYRLRVYIEILFVFFFNDTATTEIYTLSLHDALPISLARLPVDRAFVLKGIGVVVTGTLWSGEIRPGDTLYSASDLDRKSTRLNSSHANISYAVFCLKKKKIIS